MNKKTLIKIKGLTFSYPAKKNALKNINFEIDEGKFICIVGENGSGKSTLLKCILGLNKGYEGTIEREEKIGYLPQKSDIQTNFPASIEEIVLTGTIANNRKGIFYSKEDKQLATDVMKDLDLYEMKNKCFADLSGGWQQRVLIARALCATKKIILLDEPTNGLDPSVSKQIYEVLEGLKKNKEITILMVSHDIERALNYADRVIEIKDGEVAFDGKPSDYRLGGGKND